MFDIFKWFFGIVGAVILLYIFVIIVRGVLNTTTNVVTNTGVSETSETVSTNLTSLVDWFKNFYTPIQYSPGTIQVGGSQTGDIAAESQYKNPIAERILRYYAESDFYEDTTTGLSFEERYRGQYFNLNYKDTEKPVQHDGPISKKLPEMIFPSAVLTNLNFKSKCVVGGCSMQFCLDQKEVTQLVTTCEYREEYACYRNAVCERDSRSGKCGWRVDNTLASCLQGR